MSAPNVAWVGINGLLGAHTLPTFIEAAKSGDFASLKLLARSETDAIKKAVAEGSGKVSNAVIDYANESSLVEALKGADVLVSTVGWTGEQAAPALALVEAAVKAGVKVYFSSDFGSDYDPDTFGGELYESKKRHREAAEKTGIKVVAIAVGGFTQGTFAYPYFGAGGPTWEIQGDGSVPFAITDISDIGKYTARAVILAHQKPSEVPRRLRVYSDLKTWKEYADINDELTGKKLNRVFIPREELVARFKTGKEPAGMFFVLRLAADTKAHDFTGISHNELLNPGQKYFVPKSYEDYVKSTLK